MATREPQKPSDSDFVEMMCGPQVDIYVGPTKKHYSFSKDLLCCYSDYFDRCFNGNFAKAQTQKLELPEDKIEDFDIILEYILHGRVMSQAKIRSVGQKGLSECIAFIQYVDKYNLGAVSAAVMEPMRKILQSDYSFNEHGEFKNDRPEVKGEHIEAVFKHTPNKSPLRILITQAAVSWAGSQRCSHVYQNQIEKVPGFALEVLRQVEKSMGTAEWYDPLTGHHRTRQPYFKHLIVYP